MMVLLSVHCQHTQTLIRFPCILSTINLYMHLFFPHVYHKASYTPKHNVMYRMCRPDSAYTRSLSSCTPSTLTQHTVQRNPSLKTMLKIKQKIRSEKSSDPWSGVHLNGNMKNSYDSGKSRATTASPKPSFRAPWEVGNAVVGWENAGWTTSKSGHPCLCQNCSKGPPAENTGRGSLLKRLSCPLDDLIVQGTELMKRKFSEKNCLKIFFFWMRGDLSLRIPQYMSSNSFLKTALSPKQEIEK